MIYGKKEELREQLRRGRATYEDVEAADGILRVEVSLRNLQSVKRFADKLYLPSESGQLLNIGVASVLVRETLSLLNLDRPKTKLEARKTLLLRHFGKSAPQMLGLLEYRDLYGEDFWKVLGISRSTYQVKKRQLEAANLWDMSPLEALPCLEMLVLIINLHEYQN